MYEYREYGVMVCHHDCIPPTDIFVCGSETSSYEKATHISHLLAYCGWDSRIVSRVVRLPSRGEWGDAA